MEISTEHRILVEKIAKQNGFQHFELVIEAGSNKGDNFVGIIYRVTIKDDQKEMKFILKAAPTIESQKKFQPVRTLFLREIFMYEKIFKVFDAYQDEHNITNPFQIHAKLYDVCDKDNNEALLLEDMIEQGYQMLNKKVTMNTYHIEAVLEEYAKFHSTSLAMRNKDPKRFEKLTENLTDVFQADLASKKDFDMTEVLKAAFDNLFKSVEDDVVATEVLKRFESSFVDSFRRKPDPEDLLVITHGDSWCNNFLFKYEDQHHDKPSKVCVIDWQLSKLGSPGIDISYLLLANGSQEILDDYKKYLKYYYDILSRNLAEFSCNPEEILPLTSLELQFKKSCRMTLFMCIMVMRVLVSKPEETFDFHKFDSDKDRKKIFDFNLTNMDEYYQRLACVVKFLTKYNLL